MDELVFCLHSVYIHYLSYFFFGLRPRALLRVTALTVACTAEGECALPPTLSVLGIAAEIVRLWVSFPLFLPMSWLIGS
jgi:hypothetical protein